MTNSFLLDAALSREDTGGALVGLMLHPPHHYTSQRELLGKVRLAQRLLQCQGWAVVGVSVLEWNELRSHEEACIANCVEKFLKFSELSGDTFDAHATRR